MTRVGVVGCGNIGSVHSRILEEMEDTEICALADIIPERALEYSVRFTGGKAAAYPSLEEMLEKEKLDVLHVCTPHACHVPMAIQALKTGIHVFMEKPPAISREEFLSLLEAEKKYKGRVGVCFQNRYNDTTKKADELLSSGKFGAVKGARAFVTWHRDASYYTDSGWRGKLKTEGGGALINQSIHALDLLLGWLGKPVWVEASMNNHHLKGIIEVEDTMEAYLAFENGLKPVSASFYATTAYAADAPVLLELSCENGFIRIEGDSVWYQTGELSDMERWQAPRQLVPGKTYWGSGHQACIRDYYECLKDGRPYKNNLASVENTFDTMMNLYDSARNERR